MTGFTADVQRYDNWISCNYNGLLRYCKKYRIEEDYINDVYLNVRNRILLSGYSGTQYTTFIKRSIHNLRINEAKKRNGKHYIEFGNEDYENTIETQLQLEDEIEKDTQQYREDVLFFSRMMFRYINEKQYDDKWQFIFRCYFLMEGRMTYQKLTAMTGYHKNLCTRVITTIKNDIRQNFLIWLKDDKRRMEKCE